MIHVMNDLSMFRCSLKYGYQVEYGKKEWNKSNISKSLVEYDQLKHELEAMKVSLANKDTDITFLKAQLLKSAIKGIRLRRTGNLEGST